MEGAAVLRVMRKRSGTEPAEALLLACKRLRTEDGGGAQAVERNLFKLVATVSSKNEPVHKYVQEVITRDKAAQSLRPSLGSTQRIIKELRSSKRETRKENRYHVIANNRPSCSQNIEPVVSGEASIDGNRSDSEAREDASQKESSAVDESLDCCEQFQLFDIVQEEELVGDSSVTAANLQKTDPDVILCNAVEMIREHLNVSEDSKKEHHEKEDEYVYDIYYMESSAPGWIQNILSVQPYREEYELVDDDHVPGETDEDDENDENNWRNDYPDEDEFLPEEDDDGEKESEDSFSDEDQCYRRRTWNKYRQEVLQEFGYEEIQDLGSE